MTDASREPEAWWVWRAQAGDREALEELLKAVEAPLARYVTRLVGERARAEDVLQEVFFRIYRKLRWLREPGLFRPWAYRIATREAFQALKRGGRGLRNAVLVFAVVEALILIPAVLYFIFR